METTKAVGLLSGGLDSTLAARILLDQGIDVYAINFVSPFCTCTPKSMGCSAVANAVRQLGDIPLKRVAMGDEYLRMVRSPTYGHGRGLNPCIDCRIMKIRLAAEHMREIGASFLFTGEVLGQRPMSQHRRAMRTIDRESGIAGLILRPLSASHFPPTEPELRGIVDRTKLLGFEGRSRKPQIALAKEKNINDYPCPAGGCLLTDKLFAQRLKDYFDHCEAPSVTDMPLLKIGRHFRTPNHRKIVVSRDEREGEALERLARPGMHLFIPMNFCGPSILSEEEYSGQVRELMYTYSNKIDAAMENLISCSHDGVIAVQRI
jgi:tRNA U34 2-thiouridine synthase MnmA/TrmU